MTLRLGQSCCLSSQASIPEESPRLKGVGGPSGEDSATFVLTEWGYLGQVQSGTAVPASTGLGAPGRPCLAGRTARRSGQGGPGAGVVERAGEQCFAQDDAPHAGRAQAFQCSKVVHAAGDKELRIVVAGQGRQGGHIR